MNELKSLSWRGTLTLLSSLSHGAGTEGNIQMLNTEKTVSCGRVVRVPFITGNALKHRIIRAPGMDFMLRSLGIEQGRLSRACLQLLYSGGALTAKGKTINLGGYLDLREMIPLLGLIGGAVGNSIQTAKLGVDHGYLVCEENVAAGRIPVRFVPDGGALKSSALRDCVGYTRGDASKHRLELMTEDQRALTVGEIDRGHQANVVGERPEKGASTQMRHEVEVVVAGAQFVWGIRVKRATAVELGALHSALAEFTRSPYVGGKSNIGHGRVRVTFDEWHYDPTNAVEGELAIPELSAYQAHLEEHGADIVKTLEAL